MKKTYIGNHTNSSKMTSLYIEYNRNITTIEYGNDIAAARVIALYTIKYPQHVNRAIKIKVSI